MDPDLEGTEMSTLLRSSNRHSLATETATVGSKHNLPPSYQLFNEVDQ